MRALLLAVWKCIRTREVVLLRRFPLDVTSLALRLLLLCLLQKGEGGLDGAERHVLSVLPRLPLNAAGVLGLSYPNRAIDIALPILKRTRQNASTRMRILGAREGLSRLCVHIHDSQNRAAEGPMHTEMRSTFAGSHSTVVGDG